MVKRGYSPRLATALVASSATLAILIPPSVPLVVYGVWCETSIGALFIADIIPGILLSLLFALAVLVQRRQDPSAASIAADRLGADAPRSARGLALGTLAIVGVFVIVIGGIYAGLFTPTEASGVGVVGVLAMALLARRLTLPALGAALRETVRTTAAIFLILSGGIILSRFLVQTRLTDAVVGMVTGLDLPPQFVLLALALVYLLLGAIMDTFGMLILTLPLVLPVTIALGYDPVWTGIFLTVLMEIAMITPPIGLNVFVLERATGLPAQTIFAGIWPFVVAALARFTPAAAPTARDFVFHPDQRLDEEPDGALVVRFRASGWLEMAWHLYQWGDQVEVLAPDDLRAMVEGHRRGDFEALPWRAGGDALAPPLPLSTSRRDRGGGAGGQWSGRRL